MKIEYTGEGDVYKVETEEHGEEVLSVVGCKNFVASAGASDYKSHIQNFLKNVGNDHEKNLPESEPKPEKLDSQGAEDTEDTYVPRKKRRDGSGFPQEGK